MNIDLDTLEIQPGHVMLRKGGIWLGIAREGLQWKARNGERVTWGSGDVIEGLSVRDYEQIVADACSAAIREYLREQRSILKREETLAKMRKGEL